MRKSIKGLILDVDGVLTYQGKVYDGAIETLQSLRDSRYVVSFLSNSTLNSRASMTKKLRVLGFNLKEREVLTASYATYIYIEKLKPQSCWLMLEGDGLSEFKGINQDINRPEYIVVGNNKTYFSFDCLNHALRLLKSGSGLIGMMPELVDSSGGKIELNVGSFVRMLERASGVDAVYIGKPKPFMYELALNSMGLDCNEVIMVGDRVNTDIVGAKELGIITVLVKTGEYNNQALNDINQPDYIIESIQELNKLMKSLGAFKIHWGNGKELI